MFVVAGNALQLPKHMNICSEQWRNKCGIYTPPPKKKPVTEWFI